MAQVQWKYRIMGKDEMNQDPTQSEFFTTKDVGDLPDALVRETIQNSLDAKPIESKDAVTVRFYFSGKNNACDVKLKSHPFFQGIYNHIHASDNGLSKREFPDFNSRVQFLSIEDFNTVGLDGSITENDIPKTASPLGHNFYWFWRNVGRTGKSNDELGKWGLGKTVFPASSVLNTFFGLTNRHDDNKNYLMGLSVLKTHHLNSEPQIKRYPYGYFGNFSDTEFEYFATPTDDEKVIETFRSTFKLKRDNQSSSGLSVVIPFPKAELNSPSIIKGVLRQYFHPIINNELIVEVVDEDNGIDKQINSTTIFTLLDELDLSSDFSHLFKLCLWSIGIKGNDFISLKIPPLDNSPRWQKEWLIDEVVQKQIKDKLDHFDEGKPLAFYVPVRIKETDGTPQICHFKVFIEKDEALNAADAYFVRKGITISGIGKRVKNKGIRAIVVIEDKPLLKLLGLAENPAHTEWQKDSAHFRGKYEDGDKVINFIEISIDRLSSWLLKPAEGIDRELMKDVFFIEVPDDDVEDQDESDDSEGNDQDKPQPPDKPKKKLPFLVDQEAGGFRLKKNPDVDGFTGGIKIETAYMVVKGSALKKYSKYDFDLSKKPITVSSIGVNSLEYRQNQIAFNVNPDADFSIEVKGFDEQRDLYLKANYYDSEI